MSLKIIDIQDLYWSMVMIMYCLFPLEKEQKEIMVSDVCIKEKHIFCYMLLICFVEFFFSRMSLLKRSDATS